MLDLLETNPSFAKNIIGIKNLKLLNIFKILHWLIEDTRYKDFGTIEADFAAFFSDENFEINELGVDLDKLRKTFCFLKAFNVGKLGDI